MKKRVILLILLFFGVFVSAESYDGYQDLTLNFDIDSELYLTSEQGARLDSLKVILKLFPKEDSRQSILDFDVIFNPDAEIDSNGNYGFEWTDLYPKYEYGIDAKVRVRNEITRVRSRIGFPYDVGSEFEEYLMESSFIDFNEDIRDKVNDIVEGEDDYYGAVFKVADWVQDNIKYDLNTITAKAVKKSSWVLVNKQGVCDELTNLFISMLRSVGIPARFVTGTVYAGEGFGWGNHGWAEVYFPGKGWIPWDVTFGQHGWVDPSHLKLSDTVDSGESSVEYSWRSLNVDIEAGSLDLVTTIDSLGEKFPGLVKLSVKPLKEKFNFGSYMPIEVTVENLQDFYLGTTVVLTRGPQIEDNSIAVLLAPREIRSVYWLAKVPDDLNEDFVYTSELEVKDSFNSIGRGKVFYAKTGEFFSEQEASEIIATLSERDEKEVFVDVEIDCDYLDKEYRSDESVGVDCDVFNRGTTRLDGVKICLDSDCSVEDFGVGEKKTFSYSVLVKESFLFIVEDDDFVKKKNLLLDVIKIPEVYVTGIHPSKVGYNVETEVTFDANSDFKAFDVVLDIKGVGDIEFEELEGKRPVQFTVNSQKIVSGLNMKISYKDEKGGKYLLEQTYPITVEDIPFFARLWARIKSWF
ncbi:MAG: transglutaminase domain-containing protein [Candidatus Woesearchaeota archaeon]